MTEESKPTMKVQVYVGYENYPENQSINADDFKRLIKLLQYLRNFDVGEGLTCIFNVNIEARI